jgi:hypothetical protein
VVEQVLRRREQPMRTRLLPPLPRAAGTHHPAVGTAATLDDHDRPTAAPPAASRWPAEGTPMFAPSHVPFARALLRPTPSGRSLNTVSPLSLDRSSRYTVCSCAEALSGAMFFHVAQHRVAT